MFTPFAWEDISSAFTLCLLLSESDRFTSVQELFILNVFDFVKFMTRFYWVDSRNEFKLSRGQSLIHQPSHELSLV